MRRRRMTHKEMLTMLQTPDFFQNEEISQFAELNKLTVDKLYEVLEYNVYDLDKLSIINIRTLRNSIRKMSEGEISAVERVNELTIDEVINYLDSAIEQDNQIKERRRKIKAEIETERKRKLEQYIAEGKLKNENGFLVGDYLTFQKEIMDKCVDELEKLKS